jgi:hypothetical protein
MTNLPEFSADASLKEKEPARGLLRTRSTDSMGIRRARAAPPPVTYESAGAVVLLASYGQAMPATVAAMATESDAGFGDFAGDAAEMGAGTTDVEADEMDDGGFMDATAGDEFGGVGDDADGAEDLVEADEAEELLASDDGSVTAEDAA